MKGKDEDKLPSQTIEIKNLILLLGSAIGVAVLFSVFMIYYYGPSGEYYVRNIMLSPEMTPKLDFVDGAKGGRFVFDKAEFRYFDSETNSWKTKILSADNYRAVYELLENEASLTDVPTEVISLFNTPNPATLTLFVKSDKITKVFQEIVFVFNGDYYRVMLRNNEPMRSWAYFYHRKIYDHILHTLQRDTPE